MSSKKLEKELISYWAETLQCRLCGLPKRYTPQVRPVGEKYRKGGIAFVQINPADARRTDEQIEEKYKSEAAKTLARLKRDATNSFLRLQEEFLKNPKPETWRELIDNIYRTLMEPSGWPPGKYAKTIEQHGVDLDEIALVNLAQCPCPNNNYTNDFLSYCFSQRTNKLLQILQPRILIAQGNKVYNILKEWKLGNEFVVEEGVHQASTRKKEEKNELLGNVKEVVKKHKTRIN